MEVVSGYETKGKQSFVLKKDIYLLSSGSVVGKKEGEGPLGNLFDRVWIDEREGAKEWESAESNLQKEALEIAMKKAGLTKEEIRYLFSGDLLGQSMATSFGSGSFGIPLFGLYGACSTSGEALLLASLILAGTDHAKAACVTSSHFAGAEKEFRYPMEYGNQRPLSATWTVTGSGAFIVANQKEEGCLAKITGGCVGKVVDMGQKDSMNMGSCMAPAAASTVMAYLEDFWIKPEEIDLFITGDLGIVGSKIFLDLLAEKGYDLTGRHMDCGKEIFDGRFQDTHSGGSGCGCAAAVLSAYILPKIARGEWKKVFFLPTGALLSKTSFNEGKTIPSIAHGVVIEHV